MNLRRSGFMEIYRISKGFTILLFSYKKYTKLREDIPKNTLSTSMVYVKISKLYFTRQTKSSSGKWAIRYRRANLRICMVRVEPSQGDQVCDKGLGMIQCLQNPQKQAFLVLVHADSKEHTSELCSSPMPWLLTVCLPSTAN